MRWAASAARWWETPAAGEHRGQHPRSPPSAAGGGDKLRLTVAPKGFGSENMTAPQDAQPSAGREDILDFIVDAVSRAGSNPCPPVVVGVGLGGTSEQAALLAKTALLRLVGGRSGDPSTPPWRPRP